MQLKEKDTLSCQEHVDMAIDDFILENEMFPVLEAFEGSGKNDNELCSYCSSAAVYILKKQKENGK
jgi:CxxH/CxxC protein (TIGR04129 family)